MLKKCIKSILFISFFAFLIGCGNSSSSTDSNSVSNEDAGNLENNEEIMTETPDSETEESSEQGERTEEHAVSEEEFDYSQYIGDWKLQISMDEELYRMSSMIEFYGSAGIIISEVKGNSVSGKIHTVQGPPSYRQAEVDFSGEIIDGQLKTDYVDENWQNTGTILLTFKKDVIEANITRDESSLGFWGILAGEFTFLRAIETEEVVLAEDEKKKLEQFLLPANKDWLPAFAEGELTDEEMIHFAGVNVALGTIDAASFGEITEQSGNVLVSENLLNEIAKYYFGKEISDHQSVDFIMYDNGQYEIPLLGGVFEYPKLQLLLQDQQNKDTYYAIVDYFFDHPETGTEREYQRYMKLVYEEHYIITSIKEIEYPIQFELIRPADY